MIVRSSSPSHGQSPFPSSLAGSAARPTSSPAARSREQAHSPFQQVLTDRQLGRWGHQALSTYQRRLTGRQLRR